jgi:general secretion pathway protein L
MRGYAVERQNLAWALQQGLASTPRAERPERVRLWGDARLSTDFGLPVEQVAGESAAAFAQGLERMPPLSLLGLADSVNRLGRAERRYLQLAAGLLVAVLLTMLASALWQRHDLERYKGVLNEAISTLFRDAVPEAQRIVNPRAQLDQKLERLRGQQAGRGEMLSQLAELAARLGSEKDFALKSLAFQEGTFLLKFNTGSVQRLDSIKSDIERSTPYQVTIETVDKQEDFVTGTIRVRENG